MPLPLFVLNIIYICLCAWFFVIIICVLFVLRGQVQKLWYSFFLNPTSCFIVIIICGLFVGRGQFISCANVLLNPIAVLVAIK